MPDMPGMPGMEAAPAWTAVHAGIVFLMWTAMMVAMMLPGAIPAIAARGGVFTAGYFGAWTIFAGGATLLQWGLERAGALSAASALTSAPLAAIVIAAVGIYQLGPLKSACLRRCRMEAQPQDARESARAKLVLGMRHGALCVGCCWALMLLLFVGGVMNVVWIGALTLLVLAEKTLPRSIVLARAAGVALIVFATVAHVSAAA